MGHIYHELRKDPFPLMICSANIALPGPELESKNNLKWMQE